MDFKLPDYIREYMETLENNGFEAWCVGGAVRDMAMGRIPYDYDISTDAAPNDIIRIFPKTVPTGIKHGTVTVLSSGGNAEITTYRADGVYSDGRSPDSVTFLKSVRGDTERRDFTVNAICYHPRRGIYDPTGGMEDIDKKIIRAVGDPATRFGEDALRIMRAFRFSCQLGFSVEEKTREAALKSVGLLKKISAERIYSELKRAFLSAHPENLSPLTCSGALESYGIPAIPVPASLSSLASDFALRFAQFCSVSGVNGEQALTALKSDSMTRKNVALYTEMLALPAPASPAEIKNLIRIGGAEKCANILFLYGWDGKIAVKKILDSGEPYAVSMLAVNGDDLKALKITGKAIGEALEKLLDIVITHPEYNQKDVLLNIVKNM